MIQVTFTINYVAQVGQVVCVVGSNQKLGEWVRPQRMTWSQNHQWSVTVDLTQEDFPFEYKYLVFNDSGNYIERWEATTNRSFFLLRSVPNVITNDVWEQPSNTRVEFKVPVCPSHTQQHKIEKSTIKRSTSREWGFNTPKH